MTDFALARRNMIDGSTPLHPSAGRPVVVVAGARPNFMKVVPILHELDRRRLPRLFVHTGQHYDVNMSAQLLAANSGSLRSPRASW
jgi:hypothetical protein